MSFLINPSRFVVSGGGGGSVTWDPSDKSSQIDLSNGNLTATFGPYVEVNAGARSTGTYKSTSKFYYEITYVTHVTGNTHFGFAPASFNMANPTTTVGSLCAVIRRSSGAIFVNGVNTVNLGIINVGSTIGFAIDFDNDKIWFRVDSGSWNGSGSDDPAGNVGGLSISSLTNDVKPFISMSGSGNSATANFGGSTYVNTPPSGFSNWT